MSEISSERGGGAQELRDLQENYRKRKQEIQDKGEQDVSKAREETQKKLRTESSNGEAAVNHIRLENADRLDQLKKDNEQKVTYERLNGANRFQNTKQHADEQLEGLHESLEQKEARLTHEANELTRKQDELRKRENEGTAHIQAEQSARRQEILKGTQKDVSEVYSKAQEQKSKIAQKSTEEIQHEAELHRLKMGELREQHQKIYTKQAGWSEAQLKTQAAEDQKRLEAERQEFLQRQTALKGHSQESLKEEKEMADERLKTVNKLNSTQVGQERQKGAVNLEQTHNYYAKEVARIHKEGDAGVSEQNEITRAKLIALKAQEKQELESLKLNHEDNMQDTDQLFKDRAKTNEIFYKQALIKQHAEFEDANSKNQKVFGESLRTQKEKYVASLNREKQDVMDDAGKFSKLSSDPFYRMAKLPGDLRETDSHYIITAKVPEHEKDNVKILVKENKVIVQGSRRFADKVKEPEGSQISTDNYQTFREIIPLEHPVKEKFAHHSYQDGVLTVKVPKA